MRQREELPVGLSESEIEKTACYKYMEEFGRVYLRQSRMITIKSAI
jgi:hypothetical protein